MNTILDKAAAIVDKDREKTYGSPAKNLEAIAAYWTSHLRSRKALAEGHSGLTFEDVAIMMTLLKLARLGNNPAHEDSQVDACGYLRLLERCQKEHGISGYASPTTSN